MFSKKLQAITLAGISILVVVSVFLVINFTSSSVLANSTQQNSTTPPPIMREVYKVTAGNGDAASVNVRDERCNIIGTLKIDTIIAIRGTSGDDVIDYCRNANGQSIILYRLSEDGRKGKARYIAQNNLAKRDAINAFNSGYRAKVAHPRGVKIRDDQCDLLNKSDKNIPIALKNGTIVTLPDPNNVKIKICSIDDGGFFRFEMVEVKFEYKVGKQTKEGIGYVAQEFLKPAQEPVFRIM